jgi:glycosyltransferase involved in cell wall biosynthesis
MAPLANEKYVLLDFCCSRSFTHHASYLKAYAVFLSGFQKDVEIWIGQSADHEVRESLKSWSLHAILDSPFFGHKREQSQTKYYRDLLVSKICALTRLHFPKSFSYSFLDFLAYLYARKALKRLRGVDFEKKQVTLICPSVDGLALRFLKLSAKYGTKNLSVKIRVIGSESRGPFAVDNLPMYISQIMEHLPSGALRVGVETLSRVRKLQEDPSSKLLFEWLPIPPVNAPTSIKRVPPLKIGFLGSARENKGFDEIPTIIQKILKNRSDVSFFVQCANFEWNSYLESMLKLQDYSYAINFLPGGSEESVIDEALQSCDALVLPYRATDYLLAGSGIMYKAFDRLVPVFASRGVGFESDIDVFNTGAVFCSIDGMLESLFSASNSYQKKIEYYNKWRESRNFFFLLSN